jgi:hypothetical protein
MTANLGCLKNGVARHGALRSFCSASMVSNSRRRVELPLPQHLLGHRRPLCRRGHDWQATRANRNLWRPSPLISTLVRTFRGRNAHRFAQGALCLGMAIVVKSRIVFEAGANVAACSGPVLGVGPRQPICWRRVPPGTSQHRRDARQLGEHCGLGTCPRVGDLGRLGRRTFALAGSGLVDSAQRGHARMAWT